MLIYIINSHYTHDCLPIIMGKKRRRTDEDTEFDLTRKAKEVKDDNEKRLIVILENAQLETVKVIQTSIDDLTL